MAMTCVLGSVREQIDSLIQPIFIKHSQSFGICFCSHVADLLIWKEDIQIITPVMKFYKL